ncbi:hypothetical protein [Streptococcus hyovaginalis]
MMFKKFISDVDSFYLTIDRIDQDSEKYEREVDDFPIGMQTMILFKRKELESLQEESEDYQITEEDNLVITLSNKLLESSKLMKKVYDSLNFKKIDDEKIELLSSSPGLMKFIEYKISEDGENLDLFTDRKFTLNSILINYCITLESLVSNLLKDVFIEKLPEEIKNRTIPFHELVNLNSIDDAQNYLIEQYMDDFFRSSFDDWIAKTSKFMKLPQNNIELDDVKSRISEMYQRRNLIIHTNGIVNKQYTNFVKNSKYNQGDTIEVGIDYLRDRLKDMEFLGWHLFSGYCSCLYNDDNAFAALNSEIVKRLNKESVALPLLLDYFSAYNKFSDSSYNLIAKVNYFLYYKFNGEIDKVKDKLNNFSVGHLDTDFKIAKAVLIDEDDLCEQIQKYIDDLSDEDFFIVSTFPIFRSSRNWISIKEIFNQRLKEVFD